MVIPNELYTRLCPNLSICAFGSTSPWSIITLFSNLSEFECEHLTEASYHPHVVNGRWHAWIGMGCIQTTGRYWIKLNRHPVSVNFVSQVTSCLGFQEEEEEPQTAYPMSITWSFPMANTVLIRNVNLTQSIIGSKIRWQQSTMWTSSN